MPILRSSIAGVGLVTVSLRRSTNGTAFDTLGMQGSPEDDACLWPQHSRFFCYEAKAHSKAMASMVLRNPSPNKIK